MGERKDYWVKANSEENYRLVEQAYLQLKGEYILEGKNLDRLLVQKDELFPNMYSIYPDNKNGEINSVEVNPNIKELKGRITGSDLNRWKISMGENRYIIERINPDFKEK